MEQQPFDIPPEEPVLPQGDSHALPRSFFNIADPVPPTTAQQLEQRLQEQEARNNALRDAPSEAHMMEIGSLSARDQELILHWWPQIFYRHSDHVDVPVVCSVQHVLTHAKAMKKAGYKMPRADNAGHTVVTSSAFAQAHMAWIKECTLRKAWIEEKRVEWQKRRAEKEVWLTSVRETERQWDSYVDEARKAFKDAEAYPVPPRPTK
jgi:hypothetical protein